MKKILAIFLVVMVLLSLTACSTAEVNELLEQIGDLNEALSQLEDKLDELQVQQGENSDDTQPGGNEADPENSSLPQDIDPALYECWHDLVGYWNAAEGRFAVPDMEDSHSAAFRYGMWETELDSDYGRVTALAATGEQELTAVVTWDSGEKAVIIDYSGLDRDGKIRIRIGQEDWLQYMYAGATANEALQTHIDNTTGS